MSCVTARLSPFLPRQEVKQWSKIMLERMAELKPLVLCFNGKGIYEVYSGKKCEVGIQEDRLPGTDTVSIVGGRGNSSCVKLLPSLRWCT